MDRDEETGRFSATCECEIDKKIVREGRGIFVVKSSGGFI